MHSYAKHQVEEISNFMNETACTEWKKLMNKFTVWKLKLITKSDDLIFAVEKYVSWEASWKWSQSLCVGFRRKLFQEDGLWYINKCWQ